MGSLSESTRGRGQLRAVPTAPFRVFHRPSDGEAPDDEEYVVTRGGAAPERCCTWAEFKLSGAAGASLLRSVAEMGAALLNGERLPLPAESSPRFELEHRDAMGGSRSPDILLSPAWWLRAKKNRMRRGYLVARFYDERIAREVLARLTEAHYREVRAVDRAVEEWLADSDSRDLAKDPLAQTLLEALRKYRDEHPNQRLWSVDVKDSAELAATMLHRERRKRKSRSAAS